MKSHLTTDYRCQCGKLLFRGLILKDIVNTKCPRCNAVFSFRGVGVYDNPDRFVLLTSNSGEIINCSASLTLILGYSLDELVGKNIKNLIENEIFLRADQMVAKLALEKDYYHLDNVYSKRDGAVLPVTVRYKSLAIREKKFILRIIDQLPLKNNAFNIGERIDHNQVGDFMVETSVDNTLLYVSPEIEAIFGFRPEEVLGRKVLEFQSIDKEEWRMKNLQNLQAQRASYRSLGFKSVTKEGRLVVYDAFCVPIYSDNGDYIGYRVVNWLKK